MGNGKKGQALVEFALVLPLLFILLFAIVDLAWIFYVNLTMQHAVREGTRYAVTGRKEPSHKDRREALVERIREASMGLYDKNLHDPKEPRIGVIDPGKVSFDNYTGRSVSDSGARNDIIVVSLTYTCLLLTPVLTPFIGDKYTFTVKSTMTNEPFDL